MSKKTPDQLLIAFEAHARRHGLPLERRQGAYANAATSTAFAMYRAGAQQHSPVQEAGPWFVTDDPRGALALQSHDTPYDARLTISGNFDGPPDRMAYAQELARRLNDASALTPQPDGVMGYEAAAERTIAFVRVLTALGVPSPRHVVEQAPMTLIAPAIERIAQLDAAGNR